MGTLLFLLTVLVLLATLVYAVVALVRGRRGAAARSLLFLVAWVAAYAVILLAVSLASRPKVLGLGEEHCFGEMCFAVMDTARTPKLNSHRAAGLYYVAILRLHNTARGRPQRPSGLRLWVRDASGHEFRQPLLAEPPGAGEPSNPNLLFPSPLQPGQEDVTAIAFDLPADVKDPLLVIQEGVGFPTNVIIGDENSFLHARTAYRLAGSR